MQKLISPRQAARAIGVSESTLKRWCDQGLIRTTKTAGGHRRMEVEAVVQFLRESDHEVVEPELLGLPAGVGASLTLDSSVSESLLEALIAGEDVLSRKLVFDLLLSGLPITALCDDLLTPVFHRIGEKWSCGDVAIYQERRACEVCLRILHELRRTFHRVAADAPLAVGATPEGDIYSLPVCMAEQVLRSFGWNATLLGSGLPAETLELAVSETRPQLVWISVSHIEDERRFVDGVNRLFATADRIGSPLIIGGRALTPQLRKRIQFSAHGETFRDLERFARSLHRTDLGPTPPADQLHDELPQ